MTAPAGAIVSLYVDLRASVADNDVIETQTGRRYRVLDVRVQQRGKHVGRQHLRCIVLGDEGEHDDLNRSADPRMSAVHRIRWYERGGSRGRR
jgi:hypothetical protein